MEVWVRLFNSDIEAEDFSDFNEQEKDEDNSMTFPGRLLYFFLMQQPTELLY